MGVITPFTSKNTPYDPENEREKYALKTRNRRRITPYHCHVRRTRVYANLSVHVAVTASISIARLSATFSSQNIVSITIIYIDAKLATIGWSLCLNQWDYAFLVCTIPGFYKQATRMRHGSYYFGTVRFGAVALP